MQQAYMVQRGGEKKKKKKLIRYWIRTQKLPTDLRYFVESTFLGLDTHNRTYNVTLVHTALLFIIPFVYSSAYIQNGNHIT
jgi:hypothetical protein